LLSINPVTLTASIIENQITIGGTISIGEVVMTICDGVSYRYVEKTGDSVDSIAISIAALLPSATASNNVITVSNCKSLVVNIGGGGILAREVKRQKRQILIRIWISANTIGAINDRSTLSSAIDSTLSDLERFVLPDNTWARILYCSSKEQDMLELDNIYVRDLNYYVEYPTIVTTNSYTVLDSKVDIKIN
jgi:hypothetical protein